MAGNTTLARVDDVADAIVAELGPMDAMKLEKLLYYAQAWHLAVTDQPLFEDDIEAWRDGPVVDAVWRKHHHRRTVTEWPDGDGNRLAPDARSLLTLVCRHYGDLSGDDLSALTHYERPWNEAREGLPSTAPSRQVISEESMKNFFRGRQLGRRTTADLAAGGLSLTNTAIDAGELAQALEEIRVDYLKDAAEDSRVPGQTTPSRSGTGVPDHIAERLKARSADRAARSAG